jgi:serine/threonine protein kinase
LYDLEKKNSYNFFFFIFQHIPEGYVSPHISTLIQTNDEQALNLIDVFFFKICIKTCCYSLLFFFLVKRLLQIDPHKRLTADEAIQHPWFNDIPFEIRKASIQ